MKVHASQACSPQSPVNTGPTPGSTAIEITSSVSPPIKFVLAANTAGGTVRINGRDSTEPRQ